MDKGDLRTVGKLLRRPGAVAPADGIPVVVRSVELSRNRSDPELLIHYSVAPLPDGLARQPLPTGDLTEYAEEVAQEVQAWAIEHVRRFRPLPPPDRDAIRRDLPSREQLWDRLLEEFTEVEVTPGGFRGVSRFDQHLTVVVTPEQWQEIVVDREIACRNDYGVDADSAGHGPSVAIGELDETLATMDDDETFVVVDRNDFVGSTRAELPPVRGTAQEREHAEFMAKLAEQRRRDPDARFGWFAYRGDQTDETDGAGRPHA